MKTIAELNTKWWYRLLKVGHTISLFIIIIGSLTAIFFAYEPIYDNEKSYIKCANGKEFILKENGIFLYSDYMSTYDEEKAQKICSMNNRLELLLAEKARRSEIAKGELELKKLNINDLPQGSYEVLTAPWETSYELISKYTYRNWLAIIGFSLLSIVVTLFIFEFIRRSFYYILLGSLFPKS